MSYYKLFDLQREPFSTSPDPEFFFHSHSHGTALKRLEISVRLRRGLNLILGDVGTGKTTLARAFLNSFSGEDNYIFHMILDPGYKSEFQFLFALVKMFGISVPFKSTLDFKEELEKYLFQKGVDENKTIVLVIDEAQKINSENLEVLRTLLNFETNEFKLLQLVLIAQTEVLPRITRIRNFMDRIALKYTINPLDEKETREMVQFRLRQAGYNNKKELFSEEASKLIYQATQGYPRKISMLCHDALEAAVMRERDSVDADMIRYIIERERRNEG
ncbi:MAG: AAA family ATPase [Candidatus Omnitrophica bacterium]|nr:AAA family ATPase [Candidatus Omnitrophota bacterium]MDD5552684.1 AAA family ATPase [Candidatus Omnitrophota bacterium]